MGNNLSGSNNCCGLFPRDKIPLEEKDYRNGKRPIDMFDNISAAGAGNKRKAKQQEKDL